MCLRVTRDLAFEMNRAGISPTSMDIDACSRQLAPELGRCHAVMLADNGVETTEAPKAARECDPRHAQRCLCKESFGSPQPVCLRQLDWRHADLTLEASPQVAFTDAQLTGKVRHGPAVERTAGDAVDCSGGETRHRLQQRSPWGALRPAPATWPESRRFSRRGGLEESPMLAFRPPGRADGTAVDAGRRDGHEENAIE